MVTRFEALTQPTVSQDYRTPSKQRSIGLLLAFIGVGLAVVTLIANIVAAGDIGDGTNTRETLAWSFGLTTTAFGTVKLGIAIILVGILVRLWLRVQSAKETLPLLKGLDDGSAVQTGAYKTAWGKATAASGAPGPLPVHRMAKTLWFPMLAMGFMALIGGLVISLVAAGESNTGSFNSLFAWAQGTQFLGEAFLLGGIAFLLGAILAALRAGGGEVQESLGLTVKTLKMPASAKAFVGLMMVGVMLGIAQFILYIFVANDASNSPAAWFAWLGPLRELSLGVLLSSIVLALYAIGSALGFQFNRIKEIVATAR